MRSYYSHLNTITTSDQPSPLIEPRPIFRASAIFPAIHNSQMSSRLLFMGYWHLKRNIPQIQAVITLRAEEGNILARQTLSITEAKAFRIELLPFLEQLGKKTENFLGSLEVEFFSSQNLVYPFPAAVINYYGPFFSTVVHTAQRVYNDFEDMKNNSQTRVPESGFTIYKDERKEPFISLINGGVESPNGILDFTFYNQRGEVLHKTKDFGALIPYQTLSIYPARDFPELEAFLHGEAGTCKVAFEVAWIFPRLLVGNFLKDPFSFVITHSYYDCSHAGQPTDYWKHSDPEWYPESLMIPVLENDQMYTQVAFYPIYSPSSFFLNLEFFDQQGQSLGALPKYLHVESPHSGFTCLPLKKALDQLGVQPKGACSVRISATAEEDEKIPARIKVSFDVGCREKALPCNICTNLQPFNPSLKTKPYTFKWGPMLADHPGSSVWIMNSQPKIDYTEEATVRLSFYREQDSASKVRNIKVQPQGFILIEPDQDPELQDFFQGSIGWFTAVSSNPYTTTYYFSVNTSGVVGGDHGF
ncbi:MAG: hypothetical protein ACSNEK_02200 [Parachlamydiaceae bacterium]